MHDAEVLLYRDGILWSHETIETVERLLYSLSNGGGDGELAHVSQTLQPEGCREFGNVKLRASTRTSGARVARALPVEWTWRHWLRDEWCRSST